MLPDWLRVDVRPGPSANVVLVDGTVLVDCGTGTVASDARLDAFLGGTVPELLVTTHWHSDHVGGAARLQAAGVPIAGGEPEAELIAAGDPRAWDGAWLAWPVAPYRVDRPLRDGDVAAGLQVVPTPGQTPGHLALWEPCDRVLITGDLLPAADVGWMPAGGPWKDGAADRLIASVERLAALDARLAISGHGPLTTDVPASVERALDRYRRWREDPEPAAWHAARRAFVSMTMLEVLPLAGLHERAERFGWVTDLAAMTGGSVAAVVDRLVKDLTGSGALRIDAGGLEPAMAYEPRNAGKGSDPSPAGGAA